LFLDNSSRLYTHNIQSGRWHAFQNDSSVGWLSANS
jgi:hypothetical protein